MGRLIGRPVLKKILMDEAPLSRTAPTSSLLIVAESEGDIEAEKQNWIQYIERYADLPNNNFTHWFFGKMTPEQIGQFVYKHADHHLRQFNG